MNPLTVKLEELKVLLEHRLFGGIGYWPLTVPSQPTAPYVFFDPICLDSTTIMQYHHPALIEKTRGVWSRATSEVTFIYLRLTDPTTRPFPSWRLHLQIDDASGFKNRAQQPWQQKHLASIWKTSAKKSKQDALFHPISRSDDSQFQIKCGLELD